jgi:hypothetical protein
LEYKCVEGFSIVPKRKKSPSKSAHLVNSAKAMRLAADLVHAGTKTQWALAQNGAKAAFMIGSLNLKAARLLGNALLSSPRAR